MKRVYLAGSLFDARHLAGNAYLAQAIETESKGRYVVIAPQDIELPVMDPKAIRDADYRAVLEGPTGTAIFPFNRHLAGYA